MKPYPRVVIVGAGFGGLQAARSLAGQKVEVLLIDRHNYHTFIPLLYQVGGGARVELAGSLVELIDNSLQKDFRRLNFQEVKLLLIQQGDRSVRLILSNPRETTGESVPP